MPARCRNKATAGPATPQPITSAFLAALFIQDSFLIISFRDTCLPGTSATQTDRPRRPAEAHRMRQERLQGEDAVHHHAQWREREQHRAAPTRKGTHLPDALEDADDADQGQEPGEDEGRVHEWGGRAQAQAADGLADGGVGCDPDAPGCVARAELTED